MARLAGTNTAALAGLLGLAAGLLAAAQPAQAQTADAPGSLRVYVNPRTGEILREPAPGTTPMTLSPQEQAAASTSHQGLVEVPSTAPGGGVKIDLQGRFRSPLVATIGPDGKTRTFHLGGLPEPDHH
jgi:hypothetical protein